MIPGYLSDWMEPWRSIPQPLSRFAIVMALILISAIQVLCAPIYIIDQPAKSTLFSSWDPSSWWFQSQINKSLKQRSQPRLRVRPSFNTLIINNGQCQNAMMKRGEIAYNDAAKISIPRALNCVSSNLTRLMMRIISFDVEFEVLLTTQ